MVHDPSSQRTQFNPGRSQQMEQSGNSDDQTGERNGTYEPNDSRHVTDAAGAGIGAPGGSDQQTGGERWGGQQSQSQNSGGQFGEQSQGSGQQSQFDTDREGASFSSDNRTDAGSYSSELSEDNADAASGSAFDQIREHMEVIGADGVHLGTVDKCEGDRIKLTKADSGMGGHEGHHHYISRGLVAGVEGDKVRLSATAANAYALEEEQ